MKIKPLTFEKFILFIPFLNFVIFFIWGIQLLLFIKKLSYTKVLIIGAVTITVIFAVITFEISLFCFFVDTSFWYWNFILEYIYGLSIGVICIFSKKYILRELKENDEQ